MPIILTHSIHYPHRDEVHFAVDVNRHAHRTHSPSQWFIPHNQIFVGELDVIVVDDWLVLQLLLEILSVVEGSGIYKYLSFAFEPVVGDSLVEGFSFL